MRSIVVADTINTPSRITLDELHKHLYIVGSGNHRIQRITLNKLLNATTVAGGNGFGANLNQLNYPQGIYFSEKTNSLYIADQNNHRIVRWNIGATSGLIIAGVSGQTVTSSKFLNISTDVVLNYNQSFLYVSDRGNQRIQRFILV